MDPDALTRSAVEEHWRASERGDIDVEYALYAPDAILDYPQSGERFRGREAISAQRGGHPANRHFTVLRITGGGNLWVSECVITYDGVPSYSVSVMEFDHEYVVHETQYFADPFGAPAWRMRLAEPMPGRTIALSSPTLVLEPAAKRLADESDSGPRIYELPLHHARAQLDQLQSGANVPKPEIDEEWVEVDAGDRGTVRARIVRPKNATGALPVFMYIHGGGWVVGDSATHDRLVRELAVGSGAAAVFPVYDLAPEAKYPTQVEQNYAVARWITREGARHAMDASRFAVCGDSSGGTMSAVLALMAKERGDVRLAAQVLLYPTTDANFETPSYLQFADHYSNTRAAMMWFWDQYTNDPAQRAEPYAAPLRAGLEQLRGLPPTLVITVEADPLRDEGEAYAAKLREAGVDVTAVRVLGMVHDFLMLDSLRDTNAAKLARRLAIDALKTALHDPPEH